MSKLSTSPDLIPQKGPTRRELLRGLIGSALALTLPACASIRELIAGLDTDNSLETVPESIVTELNTFLEKLERNEVKPYEWQHSNEYINRLKSATLTDTDLQYFFSRMNDSTITNHEWKYFQDAYLVFIPNINNFKSSKDFSVFLDNYKGDENVLVKLKNIKDNLIEIDENAYESNLLKWAKAISVKSLEKVQNQPLRERVRLSLEDLVFGYYEKTPESVRGNRAFYSKREKGQKNFKYFYRDLSNEEEVEIFDFDKEKVGQTAISDSGRYVAYIIRPEDNDKGYIKIIDLDNSSEPRIIENANPSSIKFGPDEKLYFSAIDGTYESTPEEDMEAINECLFVIDPNSSSPIKLFNLLSDEDIKAGYKWAGYDIEKNINGNSGPYIFIGMGKDRTRREEKDFFARFNGSDDLDKTRFQNFCFLKEKNTYFLHEDYVYLAYKEKTIYRKKITEISPLNTDSDLDSWEKIVELKENESVQSLIGIKEGYLIVQEAKSADRYYKLYKLNSDETPHKLDLANIRWDARDRNSKIFVTEEGNMISPESYQGHWKYFTNIPELIAEYENFDIPREKNGLAFQERTVSSRDGREIPITIFGPQELINGSQEAKNIFMNVYGGFNNKGAAYITNTFNLFAYFLAKAGIVFVSVNARGDYGRNEGDKWHEDGMEEKRQNTYNDVIDVATSFKDALLEANQIFLNGRSNGGLTVSSVGLERPDLFKAIIPEVGLLNLLTFTQLNPDSKEWLTEYGDPSKEENTGWMKSLSATHRIDTAAKPTRFNLVAGLTDDRVNCLHSIEFLIRFMQKFPGYPIDLILRDSSHGSTTREGIIKSLIEKIEVIASIIGIKADDVPEFLYGQQP